MQTLKLSWPPPKLQKIINCARKEAEVVTIRSPKTEKTPKINLEINITTFIAKPSYAHFMIADNAKSTLLNATSPMALKN